MAVYKDGNTGKWRAVFRFTDWKGERKQTQKRGFATKKEALNWERETMLRQEAKLDMTFGSFLKSMKRTKKTGKGKYMGIQKPCDTHKDNSLF